MIYEQYPCFNSRTLGRVRQVRAGLPREEVEVSIHAPWEGCDGRTPYGVEVVGEFQFTHPGKGATFKSFYILRATIVSIHAPWEGCDTYIYMLLAISLAFQFTHPGKGATPPSMATGDGAGCFNSRTLGRVRLGDINLGRPATEVSIHAPWEGCDLAQYLRD